MIEGIEILKKTEIVAKEYTRYAWVPFVVGLIVTIAFVTLFLWIYCKHLDKFTLGWGLVVELLILCCATAIATTGVMKSLTSTKDVPTGRYEYEATLDDSVILKEVYEHYEVVEAKGDIYILRDLEPVENVCSNCKATVEDEDNFCPGCGIKR